VSTDSGSMSAGRSEVGAAQKTTETGEREVERVSFPSIARAPALAAAVRSEITFRRLKQHLQRACTSIRPPTAARQPGSLLDFRAALPRRGLPQGSRRIAEYRDGSLRYLPSSSRHCRRRTGGDTFVEPTRGYLSGSEQYAEVAATAFRTKEVAVTSVGSKRMAWWSMAADFPSRFFPFLRLPSQRTAATENSLHHITHSSRSSTFTFSPSHPDSSTGFDSNGADSPLDQGGRATGDADQEEQEKKGRKGGRT
jgi:hypothetical protein